MVVCLKRYSANSVVSSLRYNGLAPSSERASAAARGSSRKTDTKPELLLRSALWNERLRYRKNRRELAGAPDIVFMSERIVIFVDGDFWHGKDWEQRRMRLIRGHNAKYWVSKIERNITRDRERDRKLRAEGWTVLRVWESDIHGNIGEVVDRVKSVIVLARTILEPAKPSRSWRAESR
jgi:DNA mismatch endonuclease (patch repair protein)